MIRAVVLLAAGLALLASCGSSQSILGKWRNSTDAGAIDWEFFDNGAIQQGAARGKYTLGDNHRLKIEMPFAKPIYQMELAGDQLTLTDSRGTKLTFRRVKENER